MKFENFFKDNIPMMEFWSFYGSASERIEFSFWSRRECIEEYIRTYLFPYLDANPDHLEEFEFTDKNDAFRKENEQLIVDFMDNHGKLLNGTIQRLITV